MMFGEKKVTEYPNNLYSELLLCLKIYGVAPTIDYKLVT